MKQMINQEELMKFQKDSHIFTLLFAAMLILPVPMVMMGKWIGMAGYVVIAAAGLCYAYKIEQYKKKYDIQTYKEIVAFMEGKSLDEIEKAKESGKRPYQRILLAAGAALLTLLIALLMAAVFRSIM